MIPISQLSSARTKCVWILLCCDLSKPQIRQNEPLAIRPQKRARDKRKSRCAYREYTDHLERERPRTRRTESKAHFGAFLDLPGPSSASLSIFGEICLRVLLNTTRLSRIHAQFWRPISLHCCWRNTWCSWWVWVVRSAFTRTQRESKLEGLFDCKGRRYGVSYVVVCTETLFRSSFFSDEKGKGVTEMKWSNSAD